MLDYAVTSPYQLKSARSRHTPEPPTCTSLYHSTAHPPLLHTQSLNPLIPPSLRAADLFQSKQSILRLTAFLPAVPSGHCALTQANRFVVVRLSNSNLLLPAACYCPASYCLSQPAATIASFLSTSLFLATVCLLPGNHASSGQQQHHRQYTISVIDIILITVTLDSSHLQSGSAREECKW